MKLKPTSDRILVRRLENEQKTSGGIIIPDTAKEKPVEGIIMAVGTGRVSDSGSNIPVSLKIGDRVMFDKWSGKEVKVSGEEMLIMKESDVIAIVE